MIVGCLLGMDVRLGGPKSSWPCEEYMAIARKLQEQSGATLTITDDPKNSSGRRRLHPRGRLGIHGPAEGSLEGADRPAAPLPDQPWS